MGCGLDQADELAFSNLRDPGMTPGFCIGRTGFAVNQSHLAKHASMLDNGDNNPILTNLYATGENDSEIIAGIADTEDALTRFILADGGLMLTFSAKEFLY